MHPWRPWIVLASLAAFAGHAAVIYKWTDADGVVHYSDQSVAGRRKNLRRAARRRTARQARRKRTPVRIGADKPGERAETGINYTDFPFIAGARADIFRRRRHGVALALDPSLKRPNQPITWHLNGKQLDDQGPNSTQFALPHLDRGTYAIAATVTDQQTGESQTSDSVTFFVRQPSALVAAAPAVPRACMLAPTGYSVWPLNFKLDTVRIEGTELLDALVTSVFLLDQELHVDLFERRGANAAGTWAPIKRWAAASPS